MTYIDIARERCVRVRALYDAFDANDDFDTLRTGLASLEPKPFQYPKLVCGICQECNVCRDLRERLDDFNNKQYTASLIHKAYREIYTKECLPYILSIFVKKGMDTPAFV
jgi:hypothetical protein